MSEQEGEEQTQAPLAQESVVCLLNDVRGTSINLIAFSKIFFTHTERGGEGLLAFFPFKGLYNLLNFKQVISSTINCY